MAAIFGCALNARSGLRRATKKTTDRALMPERRTMDEKKTLADELREEEQRARRRFIHATRPKRPLTLDEARELCERITTA